MRTPLAAIVLLGFLAGCGSPFASSTVDRSPAAAGPSDAAAAELETEYPLVLTDGLGRMVTLTERPRRIVSLAPKNTEILFAIGAGDRVVGVTNYCVEPPAATMLPKIGGFSPKSISLEVIVSLQPDLVVAAGALQRSVIDELERVGLTTIAAPGDTLRSMADDIELLGRATGNSREAETLMGQFQERIERIRRACDGIPPKRRVSVYYEVADEPLIAAGPSSYIGEMIELCGGRNIIADTSVRFPKISAEVVLDRNPDVILIPSHMNPEASADDPRLRPAWREVRAIAQGRIYWLDGNKMARCSPGLVDVLEQMARLFYPGVFSPQR